MDLSTIPLTAAALAAFSAGILSFLSPCVLPIVPPYLAFMAGPARRGRGQALVPALFFILGLSTVFLLLGLAAAAAGQFLLAWQREMSIAAGLMIIFFGLVVLGLIRIPILAGDYRFSGGGGGSALAAYGLGLAFAFGWSPCIGPVLGAVLALAAERADPARASLLLAFYAFGLGLPFLVAALSLERASAWTRRLAPHMPLISRLTGGLLVLTGLTMTFGLFTTFAFWLLETFPALGALG